MKNKSGRKVSIIVVLAVISLISILAINAVESVIENIKLADQMEAKTKEEQSLSEEIAKLNNDLNDENQLEDKAREDGYIYPDEIVYADSAN